MDVAAATQYLLEKAAGVRQSQLDQARQSLEAMISHFSGAKVSLERIRSEVGQKGDLASGSRYYTKEQVQMIASAQTERNAVATRVAAEAGLRAHELGNIRRLEEAERAGDISRRQFSEWRFVGADGRTERYAVTGKGGITIEVRLSPETAQLLESFRREHPVAISDRGISYWSRYDIGSGRAWSQSFRDASRRELGWSRGAHGLRHSYAQDRMVEIQSKGATWHDALHAVSNELAHLSPETTKTYLR
jgi:integrase